MSESHKYERASAANPGRKDTKLEFDETHPTNIKNFSTSLAISCDKKSKYLRIFFAYSMRLTFVVLFLLAPNESPAWEGIINSIVINLIWGVIVSVEREQRK